MTQYSTRRGFLAHSALLMGAAGLRYRAVSAQTTPLRDVPSIDGELLSDGETLRAAANDWGGSVHHRPVAVLKPASVADIARLVTYANQHHVKIAMRGQGHSLWGQAQVESGIVIDSSGLKDVSWLSSGQLDAGPGAQWGAVVRAALERGLTPPVVPDALILTVGGTLSVGGIGFTSYSAGAQVDHVSELEVVTGRGELVTCSPSHDRELFEMTLAGLGQCGILVRARLRLVPAAKYVVSRTLTYGDSDVLITDLTRLAISEAVPLLAGEITKDAAGSWQLVLLTGAYTAEQTDDPAKPAWISGLKFNTDTRARAPYWDYLDRNAASVAAAKAKGLPAPSLALVLTETAVRPFLKSVLSDPDASAGVWRIDLVPMLGNRFKQPLHVLAQGKIAFTLRLHRKASAENAPDHRKMLTANQILLERCLKDGGKVYPPFAPPMSRDNWQRHYGPQLFQRLSAAKKRFDPNNVLTPGAGVFS